MLILTRDASICSSAPSTTADSPSSLLALWKYVAREAGGEFADLLEELELSLAQVKTLETLIAHGTRRRR